MRPSFTTQIRSALQMVLSRGLCPLSLHEGQPTFDQGQPKQSQNGLTQQANILAADSSIHDPADELWDDQGQDIGRQQSQVGACHQPPIWTRIAETTQQNVAGACVAFPPSHVSVRACTFARSSNTVMMPEWSRSPRPAANIAANSSCTRLVTGSGTP